MALSYYKGTYVMENTRDSVGWTHSWWVQANSHAEAAGLLLPYWGKLQKLMMTYVFYRGLRTTNVDPPRDSRIWIAPDPPDNFGVFDPTTIPSVGYTEALLMRRDRELGDLQGKLFFHGVPSTIFAARKYVGGATIPGWEASMGALQAYITDGPLRMRKTLEDGTFDYILVTSLEPLYQTSRRVGRPFDHIRGRRSTA